MQRLLVLAGMLAAASFVACDMSGGFSGSDTRDDCQVPVSAFGQPVDAEELAKCLTRKGYRLYGTKGCGACRRQLSMFGNGAKYLHYVDCSADALEADRADCEKQDLDAYPTWITSDGYRLVGVQELDALAARSRCP